MQHMTNGTDKRKLCPLVMPCYATEKTLHNNCLSVKIWKRKRLNNTRKRHNCLLCNKPQTIKDAIYHSPLYDDVT